jgi:mannose-6-phosphate isomerase-like protein (cupin superfamily)
MTSILTATRPRAVPPAAAPLSPLSGPDLATLVADFADRVDSWHPHVRFGVDERWWTRLRGDDTVDVWLLTWVSDTGTDLHDHGKSAGAFVVVSGALEEVRPTGHRDGLVATTLHAGHVRVIEPGVVHDVRSPRREPAISIHAYSPPLREMTFYELGDSGPTPTRTVQTDPEGTP